MDGQPFDRDAFVLALGIQLRHEGRAVERAHALLLDQRTFVAAHDRGLDRAPHVLCGRNQRLRDREQAGEVGRRPDARQSAHGSLAFSWPTRRR